ncbi:spore-associated protein A [Microtetraspora sp. NBRC 13810]|uniref:hypothetical protein n=1 Tax=Microtetraspora sp. NBRC 13810 TaxID=3030990 RepID=UPI0024A48790|nr:hypothetical protein [Microtetraspora sp. NBRC 13810]GLW05535.1 spore-associated protein A [Microtetraspora sp. NBRC 13810]
MHIRSKFAALASTAVFATGLVAFAAAPADATGPCGSGYAEVKSYNIPAKGPKKGVLRVYYSSRTGKNCALAYGYGSTYGKATYKSVTISVTDGTQADHDYGNFKKYAGPVYVSARHKCISLSGWIEKTKVNLTKVHCR